MTNEELVGFIQSGEIDRKDGLQQLYLVNKGLLFSFAKRYAKEKTDIEDLIQEGFIGLMESIDSFDLEKGVSFMTYAGFRIKKRMRDFAYDDCSIRVSSHINNRYVRYKEFCEEYLNEYGIEPDEKTVCDALEITPEQLKYCLDNIALKNTSSTDVNVNDEGQILTVGDMLKDPKCFEDDLIEKMIDDENQKTINDCLDSLPKDMGSVVREYVFENKTFRQIAKEKDVSHQAIEQKVKKAYKLLREDERMLYAAKTKLFLLDTLAYKGSIRRYRNNNNTSVVEKIAIERTERERKFLKDVQDVQSMIDCVC